MTKSLQIGDKVLISGCLATIHQIDHHPDATEKTPWGFMVEDGVKHKVHSTVWLRFHTGECTNHLYTYNGIEKGLVPLSLDFVLRNMEGSE
mgnify:CR=1 FL=1